MRGEHPISVIRSTCCTGIIPACAGSTSSTWPLTQALRGSSPHARGAPVLPASEGERVRDHPRMRGEHRARRALPAGWHRIIPACAGSTYRDTDLITLVAGSSPHARGARRRRRPRARRCWDHPRMRGEHLFHGFTMLYLARIIPACAGSTVKALLAVTREPGSSPHARGALECRLEA